MLADLTRKLKYYTTCLPQEKRNGNGVRIAVQKYSENFVHIAVEFNISNSVDHDFDSYKIEHLISGCNRFHTN
jgi:hypothetical protein